MPGDKIVRHTAGYYVCVPCGKKARAEMRAQRDARELPARIAFLRASLTAKGVSSELREDYARELQRLQRRLAAPRLGGAT